MGKTSLRIQPVRKLVCKFKFPSKNFDGGGKQKRARLPYLEQKIFGSRLNQRNVLCISQRFNPLS